MSGDIYKSAGIIIQDRKLLVEKDIDKDFFISPGGKLEPNETPVQALVRELNEEFTISVDPNDLSYFGSFSAPASGQEHRIVHMEVYLVKRWSGTIVPGHKVEKMLWINSQIPSDINVGSIFQHQIVPQLKKLNLID